jgi:Putative Se/S carrier protein-like
LNADPGSSRETSSNSCVAVFKTTHLTLKAEKALKNTGVEHRTVMKPRKISSDCGLAIRLDPSDVDRAKDVFLSSACLPARIFHLVGREWECMMEVDSENLSGTVIREW